MGVYRRGKSWYLDFYYEGKRYTERAGKVAKSVAEEKLDIRRSEVIRGQWKPKVVKISFDKFEEQYLEFSKATKKPGTAKRDAVSLGPLHSFFGGKLISEINPFLIEKYKQKRKGDGVSPRTINIELACLRHMFNMALKWGKAQKNPMEEVNLLKEPEGKHRILSPEEEKKLMDVIAESKRAEDLRELLMTALFTGMRRGELFGLKWPNIDFASRMIIVAEQFHAEGTKGGRIREIPMNPELTEMLINVKKRSHSDYVFTDWQGRPYKTCRTDLDNGLEKAGIEGVTLHTFRHTFGSRLGMMGVDLGTIQELLGHADITMTKRYYHPTAEHKRKAVEMLSEVTSNFTTEAKSEKSSKVVSIGNY